MKLFFIFFLTSLSVIAQSSPKVKDTISYKEYNTLVWADFKAQVPTDTKYSASVCSGMSYKWSYSTAGGNINFQYTIKANLYRNLSWSKYTEGKEAVLAHEQLHFDITELYVRKFRKALSEYEVSRNIRKDVERIYEKLEEERKQLQLQYDLETEHSINEEAQLAWQQKIESLLQQFELYK